MKVDFIKTLIKESVIKRQKIFEMYEETSYIKEYDRYEACYFKLDTPLLHSFTEEDFADFTLTDINRELTRDQMITLMMKNKMSIAVYLEPSDVDILLERKRKIVVDSYVEKNQYVRLLAGLPRTDDETLSIKLYDLGYIDKDIRNIRGDVNVWELTDYEIYLMSMYGVLQTVIDTYPKQEFLRYLHRRVSFVDARRTEPYGLVWCQPYNFDGEMIEVFKSWYGKHRLYFYKVLRDHVYENALPNYDIMMSIYLIFAAAMSTMLDTSTTVYDSTLDDPEIVKIIMESYGMEYMEIPKLNLRRLLDNMNHLISVKGSKQCMVDIKNIFEYNNVYRYVLQKKVKNTAPNDDTPYKPEDFELVFFKVPIGEKNIRPYLESADAQISYEKVIASDPTWGNNGNNLYSDLKQEEFNFVESKYISLENMFEISEASYKMTTLFRYILTNKNIVTKFEMQYKRGRWFRFNIFEGFMYTAFLIIKLRGYQDTIPDSVGDIAYVMGMATKNIDFSEYANLFKMVYGDKDTKNIPYQFRDVQSDADVYDFMEHFLSNKHALDELQDLMDRCTGYREYELAKTLYDAVTVCATMKELFVDGDGNQLNTYGDYIKFNNPALRDNFRYVEVEVNGLKDELSYILDLINQKLNDKNDDSLSAELTPLNDIKMENIDSTVSYMKFILKYFQSMNTQLRDFSLVYTYDSLGQGFRILDDLRPREDLKLAEVDILGDDMIIDQKMVDSSTNNICDNLIIFSNRGIY